jgi:hypothetical protein
MSYFSKVEDRKVKHVPFRGWYQWERGRYKRKV